MVEEQTGVNGRLFVLKNWTGSSHGDGNNMEIWISGLREIVDMLLMRPGSPMERWALAGLAFIVCGWIVNRASHAFGIANADKFHTTVTILLSGVIVIGAMMAARVYLPAWHDPAVGVWVRWGVGLGASVLLVAPLMCVMQRATYFSALFAWLLGVGAAALTIMLVVASLNAIESGRSSADIGRGRKHEIQEFLDSQ